MGNISFLPFLFWYDGGMDKKRVVDTFWYGVVSGAYRAGRVMFTR